MFSTLFILVFLMVGGGKGSKRHRSSSPPTPAPPAEDVGSEYVPKDEDSDTESVGWENIPIKTLTKMKSTEKIVTEGAEGKMKESKKTKGKKKVTEKEKGKKRVTAKEKRKGKEKAKPVRGRKKSIGIEIREPMYDSSSSDSTIPVYPDEPIDPKRRSMYSSKLCIGERFVGVKQLLKHVPELQTLLANGDLYEACNFCEKTGYGLELIREFYMRAGFLEETEGGPYSFKTRVRGVECTVTPDEIASVLEMEAQIDGIDYLNSGFDSVKDWLKIMKALTIPNTDSNGLLVMSKDLKLEYRFLNFLVCYNVMPLVNTKVVRWDRMLYMYLLGNPELVHLRNINLNVPFLIWRRMAKDIKTSSLAERLPFPLLIMRLLDKFGVDTRCSSYEFSLGMISEITLAKSLGQLQSDIRRSPTEGLQGTKKTTKPSSSRATASAADSTAAQYRDTLFREVTRISAEVAEL